jgi:UDP-GlcNAc:undecaprenyl-phosphate GlcNAc-1-phosphate transferase
MLEPELVPVASQSPGVGPAAWLGLAAAAFGIAWTLTGRMIAWAPRWGLIDQPSARKVHTTPTPRGGGLALAGAVLSLWFVRPYLPSVFAAVPWPTVAELVRSFDRLALFALAVVVVGALDDWFSLPWQFRLGFQFAVGIGVVLTAFGHQPWPVQALGVVWLVAMINAFNMLDNMDALSGGVALIGCIGLVALTPAADGGPFRVEPGPARPYLLLAAALLGFLWYNRPPARIFMGDAGSTFLGYWIGLGSLDLAFGPDAPPLAPLAALCLCAVPLYDQATVVLLRIRQGRSPFHADRQHLSHRLTARGLTSRQAVAAIHRLALVSGAAGLLVYAVPNRSLALAVFVVTLLGWLGLAWWEFGPRPSPNRTNAPGPDSHRGE